MASPVKQIGRELGVRYVDRTALVGEARIACYDEKPLDPRKAGNEFRRPCRPRSIPARRRRSCSEKVARRWRANREARGRVPLGGGAQV